MVNAHMVARTLLALLCACAMGCSLVNDTNMHTDGAVIRFAHVARQTDVVNVFVNGRPTPIAEGRAFSTVSGPIPVPSGTVVFRVELATTERELVIERSLETEPGESYTLTLFGDEMPPPELVPARTLGLLLLREDQSPFNTEENVRLNVVHCAAPVPTGALVSIAPNGDLARLITGFGFGASDVLEPPSQALTVGFDAGTDDFIDARFDLPALPPGTYATVFIAARADGSVFLLVSVGDQTIIFSPPRVRVANLSRDVGPVDVFAGSTPLAMGLRSAVGAPVADVVSAVSPDVDAPEGRISFEVRTSGSMPRVLGAETFDTLQNQTYTLVVSGDGPSLTLNLVPNDTTDLNTLDDIRLAVVHAATPTRRGRLVFVDGVTDEVIAPNFGFGDVTLQTRRARSYRLGIDTEGGTEIDFEFPLPSLPPGTYANVVVAAEANDVPFILVNTLRGATQVVGSQPRP
jgi:hypothetical protein